MSGFLALGWIVWFLSSRPSFLLSPLTRRYDNVRLFMIIFPTSGIDMWFWCWFCISIVNVVIYSYRNTIWGRYNFTQIRYFVFFFFCSGSRRSRFCSIVRFSNFCDNVVNSFLLPIMKHFIVFKATFLQRSQNGTCYLGYTSASWIDRYILELLNYIRDCFVKVQVLLHIFLK